MSEWAGYYEVVGREHNPIIEVPLSRYSVIRGSVLDLGAGNLRDCKYLLSRGFKSAVAVEVDSAASRFMVPGIQLVAMPIQHFNFSAESFDLIISINTLFYLDKKEIKSVFGKVWRGLRPGGFFVANFFGDKDPGLCSPGLRSSFSRVEVEELVEPFDIPLVGESNQKEKISSGAEVFSHQWSLVLGKS